MNWTEQQLADYMAKLNDSREPVLPRDETPDLGPESGLQTKCLGYCKDHGYLVWHDWSRKKNKAGWPDLICFLPKSRLVLVELKAAGRKLRLEQQALKRQLMYLGFEIYVVRSFWRFVEVIQGGK